MQVRQSQTNLLYPPDRRSDGSQPRTQAAILSDEAAIDLGIPELANWLAHKGIATKEIEELIKRSPTDPETIGYRQEILFELYERRALRAGLDSLIPTMEEVTVFSRSAADSESPFQHAVWRLGELELYVESIEELYRLLHAEGTLKSEGLRTLRAAIDRERESETFEVLKQELPRLRRGLKNKRSVTIGVNLDHRLRPVEAALISVNDRPYTEKGLLTGILKSIAGDSNFRVGTPLHKTPTADEAGLPAGQKIPLSPLFQDLDHLLRSVSRNLLRELERFMNVHTGILRDLRHDFAFYLGACRLMDRLAEQGLPVTRPRIATERSSYLDAEDFYNIHLARRLMKAERGTSELVMNNVSMQEPRQIFILTGPNQGGKTTYVQGVGLLQIMVQAGLFAPARRARLSPVDRILTHFPHAEHGSVRTGRFSEELQRLARILSEVTANSLLLLNESLTSTNPVEASSVAQELLKALRRIGVRAVFATHLHDLAYEIERINNDVEARATVSHLRAEVADSGNGAEATRTFRIIEAPPHGSSYARDIARRHGMSYDQIVESFRRRGLLSE